MCDRASMFCILLATGLVGCESPQPPRVERRELDYHFTRVQKEPERWVIDIPNAPGWVHPLEMAPPRREVQLSQGAWFVIACGVWSPTDMQSVQTAFRAVAAYDGGIQLGVRPFVKYEEMQTWFPEYGGDRGSPIWIVLKDGKVCAWETGQLSEQESLDLIATHLK